MNNILFNNNVIIIYIQYMYINMYIFIHNFFFIIKQNTNTNLKFVWSVRLGLGCRWVVDL